MRKTKKSTILAVAAVAAVLAIGAGIVAARNAKPRESTTASTTQTPPTGNAGAGFLAVKDPVTGKFVAPTAEQAGALVTSGTSTPQPSRTIRLPGGGIGMTVDQSFDSAMVITKGKDGKLKMDCVVSEKVAEAIVGAQSSANSNPPTQ